MDAIPRYDVTALIHMMFSGKFTEIIII